MLHIKDNTVHKQLFSLALPMILSNITVPLLGLVDTAVMGHLDQAFYLAGSTVGAMVVTFIVWLCSFLRMSTTGMSAQAYGSEDVSDNFLVLFRGVTVAFVIALVMILGQTFYLDAALLIAGGSAEVQFYAREYSEIRMWGLPASLINLVILGWLLGNHQAKGVMWILIATNVANIALDLLFVVGFDWQVKGVAFATLLAEYIGLSIGLFIVNRHSKKLHFSLVEAIRQRTAIFTKSSLLAFFNLNRDILIRTLCLEICFVFMTFQGARLGDTVVAANAILMNFLLLISFGLDGIANGAEAMVGAAKGGKNQRKLNQVVNISLLWTFIFALGFSLLFWLAGDFMIGLITSIAEVEQLASHYLFWMILLPVVACWCFLFDGVYIGLMQAAAMRNSMLIATFLCFFPAWFLLQPYGNNALWAAFTCFMLARGITLAWHYKTHLYVKTDH